MHTVLPAQHHLLTFPGRAQLVLPALLTQPLRHCLKAFQLSLFISQSSSSQHNDASLPTLWLQRSWHSLDETRFCSGTAPAQQSSLGSVLMLLAFLSLSRLEPPFPQS